MLDSGGQTRHGGTAQFNTPARYRQPFVPDMLLTALKRDPDRVVVITGEEATTAEELARGIGRYVAALRALDVEPGTGIALLSPNRLESLFLFGADQMLGTRMSQLHPLGSLDDHTFALTDGEIDVLIFDPKKHGDRTTELQAKVPNLRLLLSLGPCDLGDDLVALAASSEPAELRAPNVDGESVTKLGYTGGTTGAPKGVMGTYRNTAALTAIQMAEWEWPDELRHLVCAPLGHAAGSFVLPVLLRGGTLHVLPAFDALEVMRLIERHRITSIMLVPTMIYLLLDHPQLEDFDLSSLETVFYGASTISPTRLAEAIDRFGPIFFQFYGQAECPMSISVLKKSEHLRNDPERLASCGRPVPWLHVALLDDNDQVVPAGSPGEICVRGALCVKGYWKRPDLTDELFRSGWLHTGDIAVEDGNGFLTIVDRKKDMIVSGGFNVYPREVEDALSAHPAVAAVAVIGVPDSKWGESVKAVVCLRPKASATADELIGFVRERKGSLNAPKTVDFVESIPLSPLGKPDKKSLRARYWQGATRLV